MITNFFTHSGPHLPLLTVSFGLVVYFLPFSSTPHEAWQLVCLFLSSVVSIDSYSSGFFLCLNAWLSLCTGYIIWKFFFFFFLFRATPTAHGSSQARDQIGPAAASLHHSHSDPGSKPRLQPTPYSSWQHRILNPLGEARDQTYILMDTMSGS